MVSEAAVIGYVAIFFMERRLARRCRIHNDLRKEDFELFDSPIAIDAARQIVDLLATHLANTPLSVHVGKFFGYFKAIMPVQLLVHYVIYREPRLSDIQLLKRLGSSLLTATQQSPDWEPLWRAVQNLMLKMAALH